MKSKNKNHYGKKGINSYNNNKIDENKDYASAPYNFIEFPDRVIYRYDNIDDLSKHDIFSSYLNTGYIKYEFTNETPLYIGSGDEGKYFKVNGEPVIPGSTMRGVIRSNAEILSFSYPQFVEDRRYTYRAFAGHKSLRDEYSKKLKQVVSDSKLKNMEEGGIDKKVKGGYIFKYKNSYYIAESIDIENKTFHKIDEFDLKEMDLNDYINQLYYLKTSDDFVKELRKKDNEINEIKSGIKDIYKKMKEESPTEDINNFIKGLAEKYSSFVRNIKKENEENLVKKINFIFEGRDRNIKIDKDILENIQKYKESIIEKFKNKAIKRIEKEKYLREMKNKKDKKINKIYQREINTSLLVNDSIRNKLEEAGINLVTLYNSNDINGKRNHYIINDIPEEKIKIYLIDNNITDEYNNEMKNKIFITMLDKSIDKEIDSKFLNYGKLKNQFMSIIDSIKSKENRLKLKKELNNGKFNRKFFENLKKDILKELNNEIRKEYELPETNCKKISKDEIKKNGKIIFFKPYYELKKEKNLNKIIANELFEVKSFGRTPYLRLTYDYSIKEILERTIEVKEDKIDYTQGIFGFTNKKFEEKKVNYKSRVSFEDVKIFDADMANERSITLMSPKPTSFQLYLEQDEADVDKRGNINLKTYNNQNAKLRGQKFYWLKEDEIESESIEGKSLIRPIKKGAKFIGKIHFENLSDDELGLLLLSLNYDDEARENIGMGKPYGYGRVVFNNIQIYREDKENSFLSFNVDNPEILDKENLKKSYIKFIEDKLDGKYEDNKSIISYLYSKHLVVPRDNHKEIRYMSMQKKEFTKRNILKTPSELVKELSNKNNKIK